MLTRAARYLPAALILLAAAGLQAASPSAIRERVGIYVWGALASDLRTAAEDAKALGADQAVRVYIGPGSAWDPGHPDDNSPLDVKARRADYRAFLAAFPVVMLTAYDTASFERYKTAPLDAAHLAATTDEFRRFALELARTRGRKIVSNWEFENDCPPQNWNGCLAYYQARLDGLAKGKAEARALGYPGEVAGAFEFTIVPGFAGRPSGLVEIAAKLKGVDYLSYSSWWSLGWDAAPEKVKIDFEYLTSVLAKYAAEHQLTRKLIIGEFGEYWNMHPSGARLRALVDACLAAGVEYLFNWVLYDQPGKKDEWGRDASHFGKYTLDRALTPQGAALRGWFCPVAARGRKSPCPTVNTAR
ncbi:MAG TPA: hypothetical protein VHA11_09060 [Bryobacteraceae bacterium]|nr:hypothetical protein [Bryobacteraceae bacterium]